MRNLKIINLFFLALSLILFLSSPKEYNYYFCLLINILFIIQNILYFFISKRGLVSFEFFFMLSFYCVNFIYPVFYFPTNPTFAVFKYAFNYNIICKATAVAFFAYALYMFGLVIRRYSNIDEDFTFHSDTFSPYFFRNILFIFSILTIYYISSVGVNFFNGYEWYQDQENINPITSFIEYFGDLSSMFVLFVPKISTRLRYFSIILLFTIIYLLSGSRNMPLDFILILVVAFNERIFKMPSLLFLAIIFIGIFVFTVLGYAREEGLFNALSINNGLDMAKDSSFFDFASDLIINNRNLYVLIDFADTHGLTYGLTMLSGVLGLVPYLGTYVSNVFGIPLDFMYTPGFNTYLEFGHGSYYGLGGNMVADVYLSFGLYGVIIAFFLFGLFISKLIEQYKHNVYYYIIYFNLVAASVFINRESYLLPLRGVVYSLFIFWIMNVMYKNNLKKLE